MTLTFKNLYNITKEALHATKEPFVKAKNQRALDAAIDSAKLAKIEAENKIQEAFSVVNKGEIVDFNKVLGLRQTIINADSTIEELEKIKAEFFAE